MGRPTILTPEIQKAYCDRVAVGMPLKAAADLIGIDQSTILEWIARGEDRDQRPNNATYAAFAEAVKKARSADQARRIARIEAAARGGFEATTTTTTHKEGEEDVVVTSVRVTPPIWTADAWHLERTDPENFGQNSREIKELRETVEQLKEMIRERAPAGTAGGGDQPAATGPSAPGAAAQGEARPVDPVQGPADGSPPLQSP